MSSYVLHAILLLALFWACICDDKHQFNCVSPQLLELWHRGLINCNFVESFYGVFWYNSTDTAATPIVSLKESSKDGEGYHSGEFDISEDGSLIIQNVSLNHEHDFSVIIFKSTVDQPIYYTISVVITVKPKYPYPIIADCSDKNEVCFKRIEKDYDKVTCHVSNARPPIHLWWVTRNSFGDLNISTTVSVSNDTLAQTFRASTMDIFQFSNRLELVVCKSEDTGRILSERESQLLLVNSYANCSSLPIENYIFFKLESRITLSCGENNFEHPLIVWSRSHNNGCEDLSYSISFEEHYRKALSSDYEMGERGSLVVSHAKPHHEGPYFCIFGDGNSDSIERTDVLIYAIPSPSYLVVDACSDGPTCILEARRESNLTCSVYGIRPAVQLEWVPLHGGEELISFFDPFVSVTTRGDLFDVTLYARYHIERSTGRIALLCTISGEYSKLFNMSTRVDLVLQPEDSSEEPGHLPKSLLIIVFITTPLAFIFLLLFAYGIIHYAVNRHRKNSKTSLKSNETQDPQEDIPMIQTSEHDEINRDQYIPDNMVVPDDLKPSLSKIGEHKVQNISKNYTLPINRNRMPHSKTNDVFIAIIGKTGVGKSATGNCIFGKNLFKEEKSSVAVTRTSVPVSCRLNGREVKIVDTPGLEDSTLSDTNNLEEIDNIFNLFPNGVHVLIYVSNMSNIHDVDEDIEALHMVEKTLGNDIRKSLLLVFSHADNVLGDHLTLEQFCKVQQKRNHAVSTFLKCFGNMVVAVNNRSNLPAERKRNQNVLLSMVDYIMRRNNDATFTK